ncbi:Na(+)/H(+) exchange regulatory cofactor NHE-RF4 isoform X2 [Alligator sinensis]|uniref:Na(+)/H(+) exchange regulatory cofactor NHE-RF4 isoform X2 n=1 Tax=Alligator sinensis TaxID=38654 RepID=A0A1U8DGG2_ALLSI|nr:Na(+)/H(+) exchange regulatory cofactor NHE-RF4 isoform X2 [Alligator sinensis]
MKQTGGLEDTKDLILKFTFNPKDGIDNPALSLAEDTDRDSEGQPRFYLLSRSPSEIFGFYLHTELGHTGHVIRQLEPGGLAQLQGLQDGDRLLQVNGEDVDSMEHLRVVQKIKASGTQVSVTVLDGNTYEVAKALGRDVGAMLPGIARPLLCYITKDKSSFGFSVSAPEGVRGTFRLSVVHDGPADRAGVPDGCWLLELNGASVKNCSYTQLSRKLKQSGSQVTLLVLDAADEELCRHRGLRVTAAMADASRLPFRVRKLHMVKGPKGYGFLLQEEPSCTMGIGQFLREVDVGLPAERAGMREGDRLLAVNGKGVEELDHQQIVLLIRASGPQVTLLVIDAQGNAFFNAIGLSPLLFYEDQDTASGTHASSPGLPHTPCRHHAGGPQDIIDEPESCTTQAVLGAVGDAVTPVRGRKVEQQVAESSPQVMLPEGEQGRCHSSWDPNLVAAAECTHAGEAAAGTMTLLGSGQASPWEGPKEMSQSL